MFPVFTCMPDGVTVSDSLFLLCPLSVERVINSLHLLISKAALGKPERRDGVNMGFAELLDTILNRTELN